MAVHVRYKSLYIFLPFSKKRESENDHALRSLGNANDHGEVFVFPFGIERCHWIFSLC